MIKPTDAELEILQILWDNGPKSVRFVHEKLCENKEAGYTTTLKFMQIMNKKGLTTRDTSSRTHVYTANIKEEQTKTALMKNFISNTFKGSTSNLVLQALGNSKTTQAELDEIKSLIAQIETKK